MIYGPGRELPPPGVEVVAVETPDEMLAAVLRVGAERKPAAGLFAAAVLDYVPAQRVLGKIRSGGQLAVPFQTTPKILLEADRLGLAWVKVGFKLQAGLDDAQLLERGRALLESAGCDAVVCNHIEQVSPEQHRGAVLTRDGALWANGRAALAEAVADMLETLVPERLP